MIDDSLVAEILATLDAQTGLFDRMATGITLDRAHHFLSALEAVPTPSQTARWTRAPVVESLLREDGLLAQPRLAWYRDIELSLIHI